MTVIFGYTPFDSYAAPATVIETRATITPLCLLTAHGKAVVRKVPWRLSLVSPETGPNEGLKKAVTYQDAVGVPEVIKRGYISA